MKNVSATTQLHQRKRSKKSKNDNYWTETKWFEELCKKEKLVPLLDVCATNNSTKCYYWIDRKLNALKCDWIINTGKCYWKRDGGLYFGRYYNGKKKVVIWCNPPHSKTKEFVLKAHEQWKKFGITILMIVPANSICAKYFDPIEDNIIYKRISGRPTFLENGRKSKFNARNSYMTVRWG